MGLYRAWHKILSVMVASKASNKKEKYQQELVQEFSFAGFLCITMYEKVSSVSLQGEAVWLICIFLFLQPRDFFA